MNRSSLSMCLGGVLFIGQFIVAGETIPPPQYAQRGWSTVALGGVLPTPEQLQQMQKGNYVLLARDNQFTQVPAEKIKLPMDPCGHVQRLGLFVGPNDTIYAAQCSVLSKSTDGGKTWTHLRRETSGDEIPENHIMDVRVLRDGTWIRGRSTQEGEIVFFTSDDNGKTWKKISRIGKDLGTTDLRLGGIEVLRDGTVVVPLTAVYWKRMAIPAITKPAMPRFRKASAFLKPCMKGPRTTSTGRALTEKR